MVVVIIEMDRVGDVDALLSCNNGVLFIVLINHAVAPSAWQ